VPESRLLQRPLHVVQIGHDDNVFRATHCSDMLQRQKHYGELLDELQPGSRLSLIVMTSDNDAAGFREGNVAFRPVRVRHLWNLAWLLPALEALHREQPIDVLAPQNVHDEGWVALYFGRKYGIPVVGQIHYDLFSPEAIREVLGPGLIGQTRHWLTLRLLRRYVALRTVGTRVRSGILAEGWHHDVRVIPVPISMLKADLGEPSHGAGPYIVLFVGRLVGAKNLLTWLRVAAGVAEQMPEVEFHLVGEGAQRPELEEMAKGVGLGERVKFLGSQPYGELPSIYRSATVFLLTSHYEGFGRVVAEAAANRLPVVAPRIGGVEDIVEDGVSGYLCAPGDSAAMARAVVELLANPELRRRMGEEGRRNVVERFDPNRLARQWVGLLVEGAGERDPAEPPLRATWKRWWRLSSTHYSLLRGLEYERLDGLALRGRTLDLGGGRRTSYGHLLRVEGSLDSANIDPAIHPTFIADLSSPLPLHDGAYDHVISLNTFEHILSDTVAVSEALRVLRPGGAFHFVVPFLYRVHAVPGDYHRHTASWWRSFLCSQGASPTDLRIEPLIWDPATSAFSLREFNLRFRGVRKRLAMVGGVLCQSRWHGREYLPASQVSRWHSEYALGYYIHGFRMD